MNERIDIRDCPTAWDVWGEVVAPSSDKILPSHLADAVGRYFVPGHRHEAPLLFDGSMDEPAFCIGRHKETGAVRVSVSYSNDPEYEWVYLDSRGGSPDLSPHRQA